MTETQNKKSYRSKLLLLFISFCLCLLMTEYLLGFFFKNKYYLFFPNTTYTLEPTPGMRLNISSEIIVKTNSFGLRGDELHEKAHPRILALGGSTTESVAITQNRTWPWQVQQTLSEKLFSPAWVGNAGKSGLNTRHHVVALEYYLKTLPEIDVVLVLPGVNDILFRLGTDTNYNPNWSLEEKRNDLLEYQFGFMMPPPSQENHPVKKLHTYQVIRKAKKTVFQQWEKALLASGDHFNDRIQKRTESEKINELPDLSSAIGEYKNNLRSIIELAKKDSVKIILMTQPVLWRDNLNPEEESFLWMGRISEGNNAGKYYTPAALEQGMNQYNQALLEVCTEKNIPCLDLAAVIPKTLNIFYDDCHYNEAGSSKIAQKVSQFLLKELQEENGL